MQSHLTALRCLFLVALHHRIQVLPEWLQSFDATDIVGSMLHLMREVGLEGKLLKNRGWADLTTLGSAYPVMAEQKNGNWVIVIFVGTSPNGQVGVAVLDPEQEQAGIRMLARGEFETSWSGRVILCKRAVRVKQAVEAFGLRWFIPEIMRNKQYFRDIAIIAMITNSFMFAMPMFLNLVIDTVVPHRSYEMLSAIIIGYIVVTVFEALFNYLRQYLMVFATNKIDASLAYRTFSHMLLLPMGFFEKTTAGTLIRHMQQTEAVRGFLTGPLFHTIMDILTLPILLIGLTTYSFKLTMIVLLFSLAISLVIAALLPTFRRLLERLYDAETERGTNLLETIHGIRAVKSLALEPSRRLSWDSAVAGAIRCRTSVGLFGAGAAVVTGGLQQLMQISILALGAAGVFDGTLSVGALVAFSMLSGRVTGPLLQIVGLINQYQQTAVSVRMLGEVMDCPPERDPQQRGIRPRITGRLEFNQVTFRYEGSVSAALNQVSFKVEEGQVIGVVGRSGSGKTTITRMIQSIHTAQEGLVLLNGNDIRHIDLPYLRRNVGIVLQDNILFRGTIRENISAGRPEATLDEVMEAARMAGAEEFIERMPAAYESMVEESGTNLSGGQRQRVAIARALLLHPQLLIFDEATSALDPESEAVIQENLAEISRGRTMIIVSHRLASLVGADAILVLERGAVVDFAPHSVLIERCDIYRHLWHQQNRHIQ